MKLRVQDNSIRFRLTRAEVDNLHRDGVVSATVSFPGGSRLEYRVETTALAGEPQATFSAGELVVQVPETAMRNWATTEEVSIIGAQPLDGDALSILVEKDFACLAPREGEDDSDKFPNPLEGHETC
ncbi:MAG TPA: hypothetical protein VNQ14_16340 [Woeseiaceae bacterium]|nr:hypothetical protein [Woeseiaceae bacterium]